MTASIWNPVSSVLSPEALDDLADTTDVAKGDALIGVKLVAIGAVARTQHSKNADTITIEDFGGSRSASQAANRIALQLAITAMDALGGGTVIVSSGVDYGFINNDKTTYPSFTGITNDIVVVDQGIGDADGAGNKAGAQERVFFGTAQTTPFGMHDGNGRVIYGDWHPYFAIVNTTEIAAVGNPSRLATDNRRASLYIYNDGEQTWRVGQGSILGAAYTSEELSNFCIQHFQATGDTLTNYSPLIIERKTGNWAINVGTNAPQFGIHFKSRVTGFSQVCLESLTTTSELTLRNSNGSGDDVSFRNSAGDLTLRIPALGDALTVTKANRRVTIAQSLVQKRVIVTYSASMTLDTALGNYFEITATNNTAFAINAPTNPGETQVIYVRTVNTSGGALGAITPNATFKLVGGAWPSPSNGNNITLTLLYDGANWFEVNRSGTVPN